VRYEKEEARVEDRERVFGLVGHKVAVNLNYIEARGVEIIGTLDEARDDGVVLSEIGELGPGPTMFCPWESLRRVRERPWWLRPPHEEPGPEEPREQEFFELREATLEEAAPEPPEQHRHASVRTLERVVPIGQRQAVGENIVALTSLELFGEGVGVLRYRVSNEGLMFESGYGVREPEFVIRDEPGNVLAWSPRGGGGSSGEADGEVEVSGLPASGELEVEVTRLVSLVFDEEAGREVEEDSYDGPWTFRFSL
jgi:hypothetical protein